MSRFLIGSIVVLLAGGTGVYVSRDDTSITSTGYNQPTQQEIAAEVASVGYSTHSIQVGEDVRHYTLYKPNQQMDGRPVLFVLHGGGQSMYDITEDSIGAQQLKDIADEENVLMVAPNGTNKETGEFNAQTGNRWNDNRVDSKIPRIANGPLVRTVDDQSFIRVLRDHVASTHNTDNSKTFAMGVSNGGFMVQDLLIEQPELFAGGAALLASLSSTYENSRHTGNVPILLWHNTEDELVPYSGVNSIMLPVEESVEWWVESNDANADARAVQISDTDRNGCYTTQTIHAGPNPVYHYVTHGGGHILSSKTYTYENRPVIKRAVQATFGTACTDVDALSETWQFFESVS